MTEKNCKFASFNENESATHKLVNASSDNDLCQILNSLKESQNQTTRNFYESSVYIAK